MSTVLRLVRPRHMAQALRRISSHITRKYPKYLLNNSHQCRYFASFQDVPVPSLGDSITEGTIVNITKRVGDKVEQDETILEIETDKVTVDIRAPFEGYIAKFYNEVDEDVEVGTPLYSISDEPIDGTEIPQDLSPQKKQSIYIEETSSVSDTSNTTSAPTPASTNTTSSTPQTSVSSDNNESSEIHRIPSIRFTHGDRAAIDAIIFGSSSPLSTGMSVNNASETMVFEFFDLPNTLQRRSWTDEEIDAVNLGGAESVLKRVR